MCKVLGVTESGCYKSIRNREQPSKCELRWSEVLNNIYELLREDEENANYGTKGGKSDSAGLYGGKNEREMADGHNRSPVLEREAVSGAGVRLLRRSYRGVSHGHKQTGRAMLHRSRERM